MKVIIPVVATLSATLAMAHPRPKVADDPLQQTSRITAFIVDDRGQPSVECWEITNILESMQMKRADGSQATSHAMSIARSGDLDGLDILTWPAIADIWPSMGDAVHSDNFDLSNTFNLFSIQGGLINFNFYAARFGMKANEDDDDVETHIFSMENGDDWFYFEDNYTGSSAARKANAAPYPFSISTISATETELLRLRYRSEPKHTVVHKGACSFTGIKTEGASGSAGARNSRTHSALTVQVNVDES
ncbi:hypothetical protein LTR97_003820 [Elasticomyces elasticus]|uniref:Uncharacterized protein n=1 Tax=Elasticomyces elasticus TaxID=574655 RepID=A0AAN7ZUU2_9PEZI|nr:hypothetical protein LTR97_003820 [Elasticomyces elasticus]